MLGERQRRRWLLEHGVEAQATVLDVEDTGWSRGDGIGIEVKLTLLVEPRSAPAFETTSREWVNRSSVPQNGDHIAIRYDPEHRHAWAWDGERDGGRKPKPMDISRLHPAAAPDDRLEALQELKSVGALSEAEFATQRDQILDEI
jgi:hypothetical protein